MHKTLSILFLVSILILPTASSSAELTSRQRDDFRGLFDEITFCEAKKGVIARRWIDFAWENKNGDGKWTKVSRKMLKLADELLELSRQYETLQTGLGKVLGLSEEVVFSLSSKAHDRADEAVPKDQVDLKRYMSEENTCTQTAQNTGKALKDLWGRE